MLFGAKKYGCARQNGATVTPRAAAGIGCGQQDQCQRLQLRETGASGFAKPELPASQSWSFQFCRSPLLPLTVSEPSNLLNLFDKLPLRKDVSDDPFLTMIRRLGTDEL